MTLPLALSLTLFLVGCQTTTDHSDTPELVINKPSAEVKIRPKQPPAQVHTATSKDSQSKSTTANKVVENQSAATKTTTKPKKKSARNVVPSPEYDLWQIMEQGFQLDHIENERITHYRNRYLKKPNNMRQIAERAEPFLYIIVDEINKRNMPLELALLPVIESAFDPFAYSPGHASGLWQFTPSTGKNFGLHQSWWYDGRRDVLASTNAALDYLTYLNELMGGDWLHAIAAYNAGEGRVMNAIKKNRRAGKKTDYWNLDLPKHTQAYVPKLLALAELIRNNEQYHMPMPPLKNEPVLRPVSTGSQIALAYAARLAEMDTEQLLLLNPGFNRWATPPLGPHELLLPIDKADKFETALANVPKSSRVQWQRYQIRQGDSIGSIAQKFNTDVKVIKTANNIKSNNLRAGKFLLLPASAKLAVAQTSPAVKGRQIKPNRPSQIHVVKSGDTLWDIAVQYKVKQKDLARWNGLTKKPSLKIGQKIKIFSPDTIQLQTVNSKTTKPLLYTVKNGDSLGVIAKKHQVSLKQLQQWNKIEQAHKIKPGQTLEIRLANAQ